MLFKREKKKFFFAEVLLIRCIIVKRYLTSVNCNEQKKKGQNELEGPWKPSLFPSSQQSLRNFHMFDGRA